MNHGTLLRPNLVKAVALNVGYLLTVLLAACGFRQWCSNGSRDLASGLPSSSDDTGGNGCGPDGNGTPQYRLYGAKTSYDEVREKSVEEVKYPGCVPKQFWLLSRHGARYPGPWTMDTLITRLPDLKDRILKNAKLGKGCLSVEDLAQLENWRMELRQNLDNQLTPWGEKEMTELGDVDIPKPLKDDPIIKFYKNCRKWKEEVDNNDSAREERTRFRSGPEMKKVVRAVSSRLGFKERLKFEDIHLMFTMCRFENAIHSDRTSPWCSVFRRDEIEVMEYDEDLDYYWTDGYGFPINYEQACPPIKDFLDHFRAAMKGDSGSPLGVFRFSHSGLLLKVYARLGLFRDATPPRADNFVQQTSRKWRSSLIDPFTANLALVLFKCTTGYKMVAFVQEREVILPGCNDILCPMETVLANYAQLADACNITQICNGYVEYYGGSCGGRSRKKKTRYVKQSSGPSTEPQSSAPLGAPIHKQ